MIKSIFLVQPDIRYKVSFQEAAKEYRQVGEILHADMYKPSLNDFEQYVHDLHDHAKGTNLPEGWVQCSTYWLTNDNDIILGIIRIRHKSVPIFGHVGYDVPPSQRKKGYGSILLKLALEKAKVLPLDHLIITCDYDNIGSIRIIEKNGGKFLEEIKDEDQDIVWKYRIDLS